MSVKMQKFTSRYGWQMSLPDNWSYVRTELDTTLTPVAKLALFISDSDHSLSFSWMISSYGFSEIVLEEFQDLCALPGTLPKASSKHFLNQVFPAIGEIVETSAVELLDGRHALEVIEELNETGAASLEDGSAKKGYQLIMPVYPVSRDGQIYFQRLIFYAPADKFDECIDSVRIAIRSFHYEQ